MIKNLKGLTKRKAVDFEFKAFIRSCPPVSVAKSSFESFFSFCFFLNFHCTISANQTLKYF